jgi:hypothetical protein
MKDRTLATEFLTPTVERAHWPLGAVPPTG